MADSEFWAEIAEEFHWLDPDGRLGLTWTRPINSTHYYFGFRYHHADELIKAKFDVLAVAAGREIDPMDPGNRWLTEITKLGRYQNRTVMMFEPGTNQETPHNIGDLDHICMVSEKLCLSFLARALEDEGRKASAKAPAEQPGDGGGSVDARLDSSAPGDMKRNRTDSPVETGRGAGATAELETAATLGNGKDVASAAKLGDADGDSSRGCSTGKGLDNGVRPSPAEPRPVLVGSADPKSTTVGIPEQPKFAVETSESTGASQESSIALNSNENIREIDREGVAIPLRAFSAPPRRVPNLKASQERLRLFATLARELATIKRVVSGSSCTPDSLKKRHPDFLLWSHIEQTELKELTDGVDFKPKAYATHLTLRKFGLISPETLKKDRQKVRQSQKAEKS